MEGSTRDAFGQAGVVGIVALRVLLITGATGVACEQERARVLVAAETRKALLLLRSRGLVPSPVDGRTLILAVHQRMSDDLTR
jgi:hypothetical protein